MVHRKDRRLDPERSGGIFQRIVVLNSRSDQELVIQGFACVIEIEEWPPIQLRVIRDLAKIGREVLYEIRIGENIRTCVLLAQIRQDRRFEYFRQVVCFYPDRWADVAVY